MSVQGVLQLTDVVDHVLDHLQLGQLPVLGHEGHQVLEFRQVHLDLLVLDVSPGPVDSAGLHTTAEHWGRTYRLHRELISLTPTTSQHRTRASRTAARVRMAPPTPARALIPPPSLRPSNPHYHTADTCDCRRGNRSFLRRQTGMTPCESHLSRS